jgi:hypothetical protein
MMRKTTRFALALLVAILSATQPSGAQFRAIFGAPAPQLTVAGCTSSTTPIVSGTAINFTTTGTCTVTVSRSTTFTFVGCAAGGGGSGTRGDLGAQDGGGGGKGGGCTTGAGTTVSLDPGKTYTLVIPAATSGNGAALTFTNTTDTVTLVSCNGGNIGVEPTGSTTGGNCTTGSNTFTGGNGGNGGTEAAPGTATAGSAQANGAGGGGGGMPADGTSSAQSGGAGKDVGGHAQTGNNGGMGGGILVNAVECGGGGGGAFDDNASNIPARVGQQGCAKLTP